MAFTHCTDYPHPVAAINGFVYYLRERGYPVGVQEALHAQQAAATGLINDHNHWLHSLKALFCVDKSQAEEFPLHFTRFWGTANQMAKGKTTYKNQSNLTKESPASLVWMGLQGKQESDTEEEDAKEVSGASQTDRLRKTDFSKIQEIDSELLEELALQLWKQMSLRLKRKRKQALHQGRIDLRRTIRNSIGQGGDPIHLYRNRKIPRKQRLIILLDVSGSMDKYSFFLLRFIWSLRAHFETVEAFIFSTRLIRITEFLDARNLSQTLAVLSGQADNWSSGTKIGDCLQAFNEHYAKRVLQGQSTTIILSDGLDTGEPDLLQGELQQIRLRTRRLIWLNPLKGMEGYEPTARGMNAALPEVDIFRSAHNLNSLLALEQYLSLV